MEYWQTQLVIASKIDKIKRSFKLHEEAHTEHRPEQSDATGNADSEGSGKDEFAMPEQPTELEVNEFKLVQSLRCGDSFLPGQGVISGLKVLRAQSRACLPLAFGRSTQDFKTRLFLS
jgi:hypothetical protein